ncbi:MAG: hypothetical protein AAF513_11110 [Pseudomonadota bacterium]
MKYSIRCCAGVLLILGMVGQPVWANPEDCAKISDPAARLACFDKRYPPADREPTAAQQPAREPVTTPEPVPEVVESAPIRAESGATPAATEESRRRDRTMYNSGGLFERRNSMVIEATVKSVLNKNQQKMMFLLDNEQVWMQTSPRNLPIRQGQKVTIKSGTVGGFILATEKGTSTRVRRIK